jgi:hypothetical protein
MVNMFVTGKLIYIAILIFCAGDLLNALLFKTTFRENGALRFALAYGLGVGMVTLLMFYFSCAGVGLTFVSVVLFTMPVIPLCLYYCLIRYPVASACMRFPQKNTGSVSRCISSFCILCIASAVTIVFFRALFLPMHLGDDMVQWCIRAKIIFHTSTVFAEEFFEPYRVLYHVHYPVMIPLLESLFFMALGEADDILVKFPFPVFFAALLAFFYAAQRRFTSHRHALLFTAMLAVVPVFIHDVRGNPSSGYADVPLSFFYFIAVVSLLFWMEFRLRNDLLLAILAISFAIFTKKEGTILWFMLTGFAALLTIVKDRRISRDVVLFIAGFGLVPALVNMPWSYVKTCLLPISTWEQDFGLANFTIGFMCDKLPRIPVLFDSLWRTMFSLRSYNVLWVLFFFSTVLAWRRCIVLPHMLIPILIFVNVASVLAASFLYPHWWWGNFPGDMPRLLMFNTPLLAYFISLQAHSANIIQFSDEV